jgi:hypothetical protein
VHACIAQYPESELKDTELLFATKKARMDVDPTPGDELENLIKKVMDQPKEVTGRVKKMLAN